MPGGRPRTLVITLTDVERRALEHQARRRSLSVGVVRRVQIVLAYSRGETYKDIAIKYDMSRNNIRKWLRRWQARGVDGLRDRPRSGRPLRPDTRQAALFPPA